MATTNAPLDFTTFKNTINNQLVDTKAHTQGILPVSKTPYLDVPVSTQQDLDVAVDAARKAFLLWSKTSIEERQRLLLAFADALEKEKASFVSLLTREQGKPVCLCHGREMDC